MEEVWNVSEEIGGRGRCSGFSRIFICDAVDKLLGGARQLHNSNTVRYNFLGPNSNTTAYALGLYAGLNPSRPPGAIGWSGNAILSILWWLFPLA